MGIGLCLLAVAVSAGNVRAITDYGVTIGAGKNGTAEHPRAGVLATSRADRHRTVDDRHTAADEDINDSCSPCGTPFMQQSRGRWSAKVILSVASRDAALIKRALAEAVHSQKRCWWPVVASRHE